MVSSSVETGRMAGKPYISCTLGNARHYRERGTRTGWDVATVSDHDDDGGDDDIYIMMHVCVCVSRKMSTPSWKSHVTTCHHPYPPVQLKVTFHGSMSA